MKISMIFIILLGSIFLLGCPLVQENEDKPYSPIDEMMTIKKLDSVEVYQDVRWSDLSELENQLNEEIIKTLQFNNSTIWPLKYDQYANDLLEKSKNPGLGIKNLHEKGITGKNVNIAIIDFNLCIDNPSFSRNIVEYVEIVEQSNNVLDGSYHGPCVASLLVGKDIGTSPDADVYYISAQNNDDMYDAKPFSDALNWVINKNSELNDNNKIKVVSVSAILSGNNTNFKNSDLWVDAYARATNSGIIVLDCSYETGITFPCYNNIDNVDNHENYTLGFPGIEYNLSTEKLHIPTSLRTTVEQYLEGDYNFVYHGRGGYSWAPPYLAGVIAMGYQVQPNYSREQIIDALYETSYKRDNGAQILNPTGFIAFLQNNTN